MATEEKEEEGKTHLDGHFYLIVHHEEPLRRLRHLCCFCHHLRVGREPCVEVLRDDPTPALHRVHFAVGAYKLWVPESVVAVEVAPRSC